MSFPFLYQLQGVTQSELLNTDFKVGVIDMDESNLSKTQVDAVEAQGKILYTYLSIGEAEDYRDYWTANNLHANQGYVLKENPDWPGNYSVKFWDPAWQNIMFDRVDDAIAHGYSGMYLDIVDAYEVSQVKNAYTGPGTVRQAMIDFVIDLSEYAKSQDPNFKVIPQNAVGLLAATESNPSMPNTPYLNAIDGLGIEDLWYDGNNVADWTADDLQFIDLAIAADKFVLATSYPTTDAKQETFVTNAINHGLIPFVADRDLTGKIDPIDLTINDRLVGHDIDTPWDHGTPPPPPPPPVNHGPVLTYDNYAVTNDHVLNIDTAHGVLSNDTDADGDTLTATVTDNVDHGTLTFNTNGSFSYTPTAGFVGDDIFTYTATDGELSGSANVLIHVTAPVITPPPPPPVDPLDGNNTIIGNSKNNVIDGKAGNDVLYGRDGSDTLLGGTGNDILNGGAGRDQLTGGSGFDTFVFQSISESRGSSRDVIKDFEEGQDKIDLSKIDANQGKSGNQDFTLVTGKLQKAGQVHVTYTTGHTIIEGTVNNDSKADFSIDLLGHHVLNNTDFIL